MSLSGWNIVLQSELTDPDIALKLLEIAALLLPLVLIASQFLFRHGKTNMGEQARNQLVQYLSIASLALLITVALATGELSSTTSGFLWVAIVSLFMSFGTLTLAGITAFTAEYDPIRSILGEFESEDESPTEQVDLGHFESKDELEPEPAGNGSDHEK
ncbi:hypothetical protein [Halobaculum sp. P14]|uniref:hypothetical protein n=1 Tax=Halobaculum sp. P14 TaxID=3421638 RepID=UPI003EB77527